MKQKQFLIFGLAFLASVAAIYIFAFWHYDVASGKPGSLSDPDSFSDPDQWQVFFIGLGAIVGLATIFLAFLRQSTFDAQIHNAQEQMFNERLGRGFELLANKESVTMRRAGVRVLEDLAQSSSKDKIEQIVKIMHDYLYEKIRPVDAGTLIQGEASQMSVNNRDRLEIQLIIEALVNLSKRANMHASVISFLFLDLRGFGFSNINLDNANFQISNLSHSFFYGSKFAESNFNGVNMQNANCDRVIFSKSNFTGANLSDSRFQSSILHWVKFIGCDLHATDFSKSELHFAEFVNASLHQANLADAELFGTDFTDANLESVRGLTQEQMDVIIFTDGNPPVNIPEGLIAPKDRACTWEEDNNGNERPRFIKSNKPWANQWVKEWVEKEIAEMKGNKP